ncbi:hypothetical protein F7725_002587 [Dissostichus mawsoni]|uniref:Uncharacterized protein n=1 Tax=Dissostichus mawsoni TaxID=36200 RepID=A0A7J5Y5Y4_DISMA|nr:hypothetical protein F7725_002587 [Dissostichus mawsoni]
MKSNSSLNPPYFQFTLFADFGPLRYLFFILCLFIYVTIVSANMVIILAVFLEKSLHQPIGMNFLLCVRDPRHCVKRKQRQVNTDITFRAPVFGFIRAPRPAAWFLLTAPLSVVLPQQQHHVLGSRTAGSTGSPHSALRDPASRIRIQPGDRETLRWSTFGGAEREPVGTSGFCQAGFSVDFLKKNNRVVVGGPGSFYWQGVTLEFVLPVLSNCSCWQEAWFQGQVYTAPPSTTALLEEEEALARGAPTRILK